MIKSCGKNYQSSQALARLALARAKRAQGTVQVAQATGQRAQATLQAHHNTLQESWTFTAKSKLQPDKPLLRPSQLCK